MDKFGLFSVRERLESLGGTLRVMSTPGQGTTVVCHLPLRAQPSPTEDLAQGDGKDRVPEGREKQPHNTIRVLVVDDHAMVRQGIVSLLGSHRDMSVIGEAADGEEGSSNHPSRTRCSHHGSKHAASRRYPGYGTSHRALS